MFCTKPPADRFLEKHLSGTALGCNIESKRLQKVVAWGTDCQFVWARLAPLRLGNVTFDCGSKCDGTNIFFSSIHPRTYDVKSSWNVANENAKLDEFGRFIHQKMAEFQQGEISLELRGFNDQSGLHMTSRAVFLVSGADLDHAMWKPCVGQDDFSEICSSLEHFNVD